MVLRRAVPLSLSALFSLLLIGCSAGPLSPGSNPINNSRYSGSVHGGQQPVAGATIQLYTVGTTADGSAATPLLTSTVTSDSTGSFTITNLYSCTNATEVYIVATGGNPGLSTPNANIALMAALGPCSSLTPSTFISINELTTAAAVYALAPYMTSATAIGSSPSDVTSLDAAFTLANQLVNTTTGTSPGANVPSGFTVPTTELNTLADILSACINSTGGTAGDGSLCGQLFSLSTVSPNPAPTNTIAAMLNIANNPTLNTSALYALAPPTPPFQPTLTSAPGNFAVVTTSSSGGVQANPMSLTFPDTPVGVTTLAQTITLQNTGTSSPELDITISGTNGSDFAFIDSCDFTGEIYSGSICQLHVTATPSGTGARTATLQIDTGQGQPIFIPLSVNGITPPTNLVTLTPSTLTYILAGTAQDLTLTNSGSTTLNISSIQESDYNEQGSGPASFSIVNSTCGASLASQASCAISVASSAVSGDVHGNPLRAGGSIIVLDVATGGYQYATLNSQNLGSVGSPVESLPATQQGYSQTVSASYAGYNAYGEFAWPSITFSSIAGANPSDFSVQLFQNSSVTTQPCDPTPSASASPVVTCGITYTFTPTATGARSAKAYLTYSGNYSQPPTGTVGQPYVFLQATGATAGPSFTVNQSSISTTSYYPVSTNPSSAGPTNLTLTNMGSTTIDLAASFTGANASYMSASVGNCSSVAPHSTCTFTVSFSGPAVGNYSANLIFQDANSTFSISIPITAGTSYWPPIVSPSVLTFANQPVGSTSTKQYFHVMDGAVAVNHPISVSLQPNSNFTLPDGSTCAASDDENCSPTVAFAPQAAGSISEYVTITDQTDGLQTQVHLTGTGVSPDYTLSAYSVAFPAQNVGTSSTTTVTLTNVSTHTITVSGVSVIGAQDGNFTETNNCSTVAINGTCSINITFVPFAGMQSASVQITSNASNSVPDIYVSGTGQ